MVEAATEHFIAHAVVNPLHIAEGLPEGVTAKVPLKPNRATPLLDQAVHRRDRESPVVSLPGLEQEVLRVDGFDIGQVVAPSPVDGLVHHQHVGLPGFRFGDWDRGSGFLPEDVLHLEPQEVSHSDTVVDPEDEQEMVTGAVPGQSLDGLNCFQVPDRIDGDPVSPFGGVEVSHRCVPWSVCHLSLLFL